MTRQFHNDGQDPKDPPICWALHKQFNGGWWEEPERWAVSPVVAETAKMWTRTHSYGAGTRRGDKALIQGRYATRQEAEAARLAAMEVYEDTGARMKAVQDEMEEACRPYLDRLKQLNAERADRVSDIAGGNR